MTKKRFDANRKNSGTTNKKTYANTASDICKTAISAALIAVFSQIVLPLPSGVPLTAQTFAIAFVAYVFGKTGIVAVGLYLALGALGVPVFSGFNGGFGVFVGFSGGFLWGFLLLAFFCVVPHTKSHWQKMLFGGIGILFCHAAGVIQYLILAKVPFWAAVASVSLPYLPKDLLSVVGAYFLSLTVSKSLAKAGIITRINSASFNAKTKMDKKETEIKQGQGKEANKKMSKKGICYIFGAAPTKIPDIKICDGDLIVSADGGYDLATKMGLKTDIFVGDCDSLGFLPQDAKRTIKLNVEKNDTDVFHAAVVGMEEGFEEFVLVGCSGGARSDHTIANIQTMIMLAKNGKKCKMIDEKSESFVLNCGSLHFGADRKGVISVFSLTEKSIGCCETGLKYSLENATLTFDFPLGVSNEFCGTESTVSVENGILLITTHFDIVTK